MASIPSRLYRAMPAVLLGILLNTLDAVSTGLLIFPTAETGSGFGNLQVQAMSLYLMSTITSQLSMTLGGSLFPGALGSMLIEILPFLRGIASSIQDTLGSDSPNLLPTVLAAYAMTSLLIGAVFVILGALRCGRLVEYFPRTVLTGTIGAIGLSLFLLALQLTLPPTSPDLNLSSAGSVLFNRVHIPLLFASVLPAMFLSVSIRLSSLAKITRGFTEHALYVPVYVLCITGCFWAVVGGIGDANSDGMKRLATIGWLFTVEESVRQQSGIGNAWNYWSLFNFSMVKWSALAGATQNIVLLVVIGVLNLPIYIPSMALSLDVPAYNMNHELLGHGISNILAGVLGTVPNLVVFSNSRFFTLAGGGRFEAMIVIALTIVLFFVSSLILPYIPTILASTLVLFLGIELMTEALWESTKTLLWCEWTVVLGTLVACTFVGFAPGFGIGIALAMVMHLGWSTLDSKARVYDLLEMQKRYELEPASRSPFSRGSLLSSNTSSLDPLLPTHEKGQISVKNAEIFEPSALYPAKPNVAIIRLTGYVFFATIPSLERKMKIAPKSTSSSCFILDLTHVHRIETSVAQFFERKSRQYASLTPPVSLVIAGVPRNSGVHADLERGGVTCLWDMLDTKEQAEIKEGVVTFTELREAVHWSNLRNRARQPDADLDVLDRFCRLFADDSWSTLFSPFPTSEPDLVSQMREAGITVRRADAGDVLLEKDAPITHPFLLVRGRISISPSSPTLPPAPPSRPSLQSALFSLPPRLLASTRHLFVSPTPLPCSRSPAPHPPTTLLPSDAFGFLELLAEQRSPGRVMVEAGPCWVLETSARNETGLAWGRRAEALLRAQKGREGRMLEGV